VTVTSAASSVAGVVVTDNGGIPSKLDSQDPNLTNEERKKIMNAPKRIKKIENMLERHKADIDDLDKDMIADGTNRGKLSDLQKKKDKVTEKMDVLYAEYDDLLMLL
jgi:hypothetical protein